VHIRNEGSHAFVFGIQQVSVPFIQTGIKGFRLHDTVPLVHCGAPDVHEKPPELLLDEDELVVDVPPELLDELLLELDDDELLLELLELEDEELDELPLEDELELDVVLVVPPPLELDELV